MTNGTASKTLELILNNLLSTLADNKITVYLNSPNIVELTSIDTSFSLSVSGQCPITAFTKPINTSLDVLCKSEIPLEINSTGEVTIPALQIEGSTNEKTIPIELSLNGYHSFDIKGNAKGVIPKLKVEASIPTEDVKLKLYGNSNGEINIKAQSEILIPPIEATGKTTSTDVEINVTGKTAQDLKLTGIVTGTLPQLKVIGNTAKTQLELDLEGRTFADISSASIDAIEKVALDRADYKNMPLLRHTGNTKRGIKLRLIGKASGYLNSIPVDGLTTAEEISLPMIEESNCSFSLASTGKLNIPALDVSLETPEFETKVYTNINDKLSLKLDGHASGKIPSKKITGTTIEDIVISEVVGKSTGTLNLDAIEEVTIPVLDIIGSTLETSIPIEITARKSIDTSIIGIASGIIPETLVSGQADVNNLPVIGEITSKPNFISLHPNINGYISNVDTGLLTFREDSTNNLITLAIESISYITFETDSSIISPNKFNTSTINSSIEKALVNKWYKAGKLKLYGSNTTNPINKIIDTDDIKYINKGVMWVEEYVVGGILNTVYNIDNCIGVSTVN